jgi:hypothetical protein
VRFYGTIDVGYGYQTHGAPFDKNYSPAVDDLLGKMNRGGMGLLSPNGLSQSNIGIQIKEPLGQGWSFVAQLEAGFDPYSLNLADGPGSSYNNIHVLCRWPCRPRTAIRAAPASSTTRSAFSASATTPMAR